MSKRRRQRTNPSIHDDNGHEMPEENEGPRRFAMVFYRDKPGWRLVECSIPQEVVDQYVAKRHEPDALPIVAAKAEAALMRMTAGRR